MSNTDSEHVARVLIERWVSYFGVPLQINSDAGANLISDLMKHLYKLLNIKMSHSLPYVPQQNGQPFQKDDLVWRLKGRYEIGSRKFQKRYDGIYIVLEKL